MLLQHTPVHGRGEQVLIPAKVVPPGQGGLTSVHAPLVVLQHAMITGQHAVQLQECVVSGVQFTSVVVVQVPVRTSQHLPRQGVGVHDPLQIKVLGAAQVAIVAPVTHEQSLARQQMPRQGAGEHVPPQ
jgi:hypothetical protein